VSKIEINKVFINSRDSALMKYPQKYVIRHVLYTSQKMH
jgi:hypothetical protein